jgi:hypothetical protein
VGFDDRPADREPHAHPVRLGRVKRLEQPLAHRRADPGAATARRLSSPVLVAIRHAGHWFYTSADDPQSKLAFRLVQTLIGMRLSQGRRNDPTLTIPVAK